MDKTVVLIINKQVLVRDGMRELLTSEPDLEIIGMSPSDDILNVIEEKITGCSVGRYRLSYTCGT